MDHISQKTTFLGNLRNGQYFRPVYDCQISPFYEYQRLYSKKGVVTVIDSWNTFYKLSAVLPVRRVIKTE